MRIALLHTRLSSYFSACLEEFKQQTSAEILIYAWPNQAEAPFDSSLFDDLGQILNRYDYKNQQILDQVLRFQPNAVLVSGWRDKGYVNICRQLKAAGIPVIAGCDTQWQGTLRQHIASWVAPAHIQKFIDILWITGERQRYLAQALGYSGDRCWDGYYACDWRAFAQAPSPKTTQAPFFLYVGRYVPEKGLDTLATAYQGYRQSVAQPWSLVCAGAGPLRELLIQAGAEDRGFVQPKQLPTLMHQAAAFILPSRFEPWGVVAHEAAASSLPLILSDACGAGVHLLKPHFNGYSFPAGSISGLMQALQTVHHFSAERRLTFSQASYELSKQYTPHRWAETLAAGIAT